MIRWAKTSAPVCCALIDQLLDAGIALDAVGLQGHLQPGKAYSDKVFVDFLWKLHERGLNIYISEFDIDDSTWPAGNSIPRRTRWPNAPGSFLREVLKVPLGKSGDLLAAGGPLQLVHQYGQTG